MNRYGWMGEVKKEGQDLSFLRRTETYQSNSLGSVHCFEAATASLGGISPSLCPDFTFSVPKTVCVNQKTATPRGSGVAV